MGLEKGLLNDVVGFDLRSQFLSEAGIDIKAESVSMPLEEVIVGAAIPVFGPS